MDILIDIGFDPKSGSQRVVLSPSVRSASEELPRNLFHSALFMAFMYDVAVSRAKQDRNRTMPGGNAVEEHVIIPASEFCIQPSLDGKAIFTFPFSSDLAARLNPAGVVMARNLQIFLEIDFEKDSFVWKEMPDRVSG